jgi:serine/threonine protein kinase/Tol biopolymer transport system component
MAIEAGQQLLHYRLVEKIGEGGMGVVWKATDTTLDREVAIKILPGAFADDAERIARFEREAKLLASLNHPNLATVFGVHESDGTRFLAMELIPGEDLAQRLTRGRLPVEQTLDIARQVAEALEAAHERDVIHRDLKPANIKVSAAGGVRILDFGLAKALAPQASAPSSPESVAESPTLTADMTRAGVLLGTAAYMSPEQARGKPVDKRADIWAFGVVVFEMLSGHRAFGGKTATDVLARVIEREPDWESMPADTPGSVRKLLRRCLTKDPRDRLRDIGDARLEILEAREQGDESVTKGSPRRHRLLAASIAAGLAIGIAIGFALSSGIRGKPTTGASYSATFSVALPDEAPVPLGIQVGVQRVAISPDGRRLVYVASDPAGQPRLYTRTLDELGFEPIPGAENGWQPFFSPDGAWVAFFTPSGELKKVSFGGGPPVTILEGIANSQWAFGTWGDDDRIVFAAWTSGLQRISSDGGQFERLSSPDDEWHEKPEVLPGSETVLYQQISPDGSRIVARSLANGSEKVIVENAGEPKYLVPGHLFFRRQGTVMAAAFDIRRLELTGQALPLDLPVWIDRPPYLDSIAQLAVSRTGTLVYIPEEESFWQENLVWVSREGEVQHIRSSTGNPVFRLSPDGRRAAISVWEADRTRIEVLELERNVATSLAEAPSIFWFNPVWSPDGSEIVFGTASTAEGALFRKTVDGGEPAELLLRVATHWGAVPWSFGPNGVLAFTTDHPETEVDIRFYSPDQDAELPTTLSGPHNEQQPAFSPDGRWLAYQSDESGAYEIYVSEYPGGGHKRRVSTGGGAGPVWSLDGSELFFQSEDGRRLFAVDIAIGSGLEIRQQHLLFEGSFEPSNESALSFDLSPDGRRFLMRQRPEGDMVARELVLVLDWFSELERLVP